MNSEPLDITALTEEDKILLREIKEGKHECKHCKELAAGLNALKQPVCDIPTNHSSEDCAVYKPEDVL